MKLYQFAYSPFAAKVRKCLELKGLAFAAIDVPFLDRRQLMEVSGGAIMVPVLADGDTVVRDSARITEYLDERYAPSLRPAPLTATATVFEAWADQLLEDVAFRLAAPAIETRIADINQGREDARALFRFTKERKYGSGCLDSWRAAAGELRQRMSALLAPLAHSLTHQPFLLGQQATLADAAVFGQLAMIEWALPGTVATSWPGLAAWYVRVDAARGVGSG